MRKINQFISKHISILTLVGLILTSSLVIVFSNTGAGIKPKEVGVTVFSSFQGLIGGVVGWFSDTINSIDELRKLKIEYDKAVEKIEEYEGIERSFIELRQENAKLRELLKFSEESRTENIPAKIIGKDPENIFSTIIINKGFGDGIRRNMPVMAFADGMYGLVGKVVEVGLNSAIILPIYDSSCFVAARLQDSRYEGLISGSGISTNEVYMEFVTKKAKEEIEFSDLVITSGMKSIYPPNIYIGRVRKIQSKDYEDSLKLYVEPVINFSKLEYVFVVKYGE